MPPGFSFLNFLILEPHTVSDLCQSVIFVTQQMSREDKPGLYWGQSDQVCGEVVVRASFPFLDFRYFLLPIGAPPRRLVSTCQLLPV